MTMFPFTLQASVWKAAKKELPDPSRKVVLNSSKENPDNARKHNLEQQEVNPAHLLSIPAKFRERIFRQVFVDTDTSITVSAQNSAEAGEPALAMVCHATREWVLPMFYRENEFVAQVHEYNIREVLPWLKRYDLFQLNEHKEKSPAAHKHSSPATTKPENPTPTSEQLFRANLEAWLERTAKNPKIKFCNPTYRAKLHAWLQDWDDLITQETAVLPTPNRRASGMIIRTDGQAHWSNLQHWLQLAHSGEVAVFKHDDFEGGQWDAAVKGAFTVVMGLKHYPWKTAEHVLQGVREMLASGDAGWAVDEQDVANAQIEGVAVQAGEDGDGADDSGVVGEDEESLMLTASDEEDIARVLAGRTERQSDGYGEEAGDDNDIIISDSEDELEAVSRRTAKASERRKRMKRGEDEDDEPEPAAKRAKKISEWHETLEHGEEDADRAVASTDDGEPNDEVATTLRKGFVATMKEVAR